MDHDILLKILARRIKDQRLLNLLEKIINCESMNFGLPPGKELDEVEVSDRLGNCKERKLHTMYIDSAVIITIASVLGALTAIGAVVYKIIKWFQAQQKQTADIEDLKEQEKEDIKEMEDELCLLTYAVLACLKGLKEQGCNGPVTEAIGKIEKHINQKAHGQET